MLGTAVCCTALWENSLDIKYYFPPYVLFQIFTHCREYCWLWDAVPSISKLTKETCWLVNISTLSNPLQLYFVNFSFTLYLCHICCVIERIFKCDQVTVKIYSICNIAAGKYICFTSILNSLKIGCWEKNLHKCVIQVIF